MAQITSDETEFIHIIGSMELAMANVEDEHKMKAKYMNAREPFKKLFDWSKGHAVANQYWYAQLKITFVVEPPFRLKSTFCHTTEEDIQRFQEEDESGDKAFSDKDEEHEYEECAADGKASVSHQYKTLIKFQNTGAADIIKSTKHMTAPAPPSRKALRPLFLQMRNFLL
ncbi:hypothetical protein T4D_16532 [Trichinella pseudospiralis]|uniref:Uncharacterized protein n=1 Tax=Trichinella pseudospiralis TaxID=6337 RepID=A0A0V1FBT8_TRIPS|nr:hypothetical protein T4D_16532 [Trichinella pseudospiralis]